MQTNIQGNEMCICTYVGYTVCVDFKAKKISDLWLSFLTSSARNTDFVVCFFINCESLLEENTGLNQSSMFIQTKVELCF